MVVQSPEQERITAAIQRAVNGVYAMHYVNSPMRANALLLELNGHVRSLLKVKEDDPLLYAYAINDQLPYIARFVIEIQKWVRAVIDATPDQLQETGAQL